MNRKSSGLTIMELLVVITIFAFFLVMIFPSWKSFSARWDAVNSARQVIAVFNQARFQAVSLNQSVRVTGDGTRLFLQAKKSKDWKTINEFTFPRGMEIKLNNLPVFSPLGFVSPTCSAKVKNRSYFCQVFVSLYGRIRCEQLKML